MQLVNLQGLRGIAALLVMMHHALPHFKAMNLTSPVFEYIAERGYMGVDIFFVISGYVMAKTSYHSPRNISSSFNFVGKRLVRVYLGYWPFFCMAFLVFYFIDPRLLDQKQIFQSFLILSPYTEDLLIVPAWSLTYELYFYIIIAMMLLFQKNSMMPIFLIMLCMIIGKHFFIGLGESQLLDFFMSAFLSEFILGYCVFVFWGKISAKAMIPLGITVCIIFLVIAVRVNIGYGWVRVVTYGGFALFLVFTSVLLENYGVVLFKGLLKIIGDASYTIYLSHTILLDMFYASGLRVYLTTTDVPLFGFVLTLMAIIVLSVLFYKHIELPLYKQAKSTLLRQK